MKKYLKIIILLILQTLMFYILPLFAGPTDIMGMVLLILISTFIISVIVGSLKNKCKYIYPIIVAILFIPTVWLYYNETALIHSIWYLIDSYIGVIFGTIINFFTNKINKKVAKKM